MRLFADADPTWTKALGVSPKSAGPFFQSRKHQRLRCQAVVDRFTTDTRRVVAEFCETTRETHKNMRRKNILRRPFYYNATFAQSGPEAHGRGMETLLSRADHTVLRARFPALRDAFSLFPRNPHFTTFLTGLLEIAQAADVARFRQDCAGKRVVLHTSCHHRLDETKATIASFEAKDKGAYHHVILLGAKNRIGENDLGLSFAYDGLYLQVPTPDTYEHLHRKLFYAYMLFDLLAQPEMVIKIDDNLVLEDPAVFRACLDRVRDEKAQYAGRVVGTQTHDIQWHGWHVGKCNDPLIDTRGYQYPMPRSYLNGGYGYVLGPEGIAACSYMYLTMKQFFDMEVVGLEDAHTGHAIFTRHIDPFDVTRLETGPPVVLALPGLTTKECLSLEAAPLETIA